MSVFRHQEKPRRVRKFIVRSLIIIFLALFAVIALGMWWYNGSIKPVDPENTTEQIITVNIGDNEATVSNNLEDKGLIKSALAYQLYVKKSGLEGKMQAGGYKISPSMPVSEIADKITNGDISVDLITILPAQRLDQIKETFAEKGYSEDEINKALDPSTYSEHPALADKPVMATLEGYLYPESFQWTLTTPLETVVSASLDEMALLLSDQMKQQLAVQELKPHEAVILASIVEREVDNPEDRTKVAQVFLKRLREGMPLGSDPTALYGALLFGIEPSVSADTPYNTRLYEGLPPGPINNISAESLKAVASPAGTDYLYFVSGDDGNTYFSNTLEEHEALTAQHCIELCSSY